MNTPNKQIGSAGRDPGGREASGPHQGLHRPDEDQRIKQALDHVGLADQGETVEDQWRDRRGRGLPNSDDERTERR